MRKLQEIKPFKRHFDKANKLYVNGIVNVEKIAKLYLIIEVLEHESRDKTMIIQDLHKQYEKWVKWIKGIEVE